VATALLYAGCAAVYGLLAALIALAGRPSPIGLALAGAATITAAWAAAVAWHPGQVLGGLAGGLELARALAWYGFVLYLFRRALPGHRRLFGTLALVGLAAALAALALALVPAGAPLALPRAGLAMRLLFALGILLLIENLYRNIPEGTRWHAALPAVALGGLFVYDLFLYSDAALFRRLSPVLLEGRAIVTAIVAPLLAVAAARNRDWGIGLHVSREVVFHSATLVLGGSFLVGLAAAGEVFRRFGADWGRLAEISLVFAGAITLAVVLTSGAARARLRALVVDPFYSHRYDYRREWTRCIETLSPAGYTPLSTRVIRAVADIVDSPGGALFLRGASDGVFRWAGSWNQPASAASLAPEHPLVAAFAGGARVVVAPRGATAPWVAELPDAWLAVPLGHAGRLLGFVLLSRSRSGFKLDREVFELLRILGREVAITLAEQQASERLLELGALHEYGRRFAFVAHDIKNVAGQLSMLLANAEHHLGNPDFQRDMLLTVRSSVERITALLARLRTPEGAAALLPAERLGGVVAAARRARGAAVEVETDGRSGAVVMPPAAFDAVLAHLLDNALEASDPGEPVGVRLCHEGRRLLLDIVDRGPGMSPEFIRDELFRPFGSTKRDGLGIGVYEARELLREAGGDLVVMSRPGRGTTMRLILPLAGETLAPRAAVALSA
jgi:putative PEP-CTERM system histidine kinase